MASYQPVQGASTQSMTPTLYPPSSEGLINPRTFLEPKAGEDLRLSRTPSPTPSEVKELQTGAVDWKGLLSVKFWFRKDWILYYVILTVILVITTLTIVFHTQIVDWLTPATKWLHGLKAGWLVPIAVLFVISFPPLFGHEIVAVLCGLVWGLWIGFAIVSAGTMLGEIGNFYAFKYCCRSRGEKLEKSKISYACLARVVRDGGFKIALIARLSAIPGHFTTAIFSTCGMGIFVFTLAALFSMPKQFITVYLGVILEQTSDGTSTQKSRLISDIVVVLTFLITIAAMWYILHKMNAAKPLVIYDRRKARQAKLLRAENSPYSNEGFSSSIDVFQPNISDSDIPLTTNDLVESRHQQWDRHGKAVGYAADPSIIHTPKPLVANATFLPSTYPRDVEEGGDSMNKPARQESADVVGWHRDSPNNDDPYASDSFIQIPSSNAKNPYHNELQQTPTQSNFVNGPLSLDPNPTNIDFEDVYASTTSFHSALGSPRQEPQAALPNPFSTHVEQPTFQPEISRSPPQPRSPPSYMDLR